MSISFSLLAKNEELVRLDNQACFSSLWGQDSLNSEVRALNPRNYNKAKNIDAVRYYVEIADDVSKDNARLWINAVLNGFGMKYIIPEQTADSILENGFYIEGTNVTGPLLLGALSLIRYVWEESNIVNSFVELMSFDGMDETTAIVLAHRVYVKGVNVRLSGPRNPNHTVYTGKITEDTLKDAWDNVWLLKNKTAESWVASRKTKGLFKFFSEKGNMYVYNDLFYGEADDFATFKSFLENVIYPLRDAHFASKQL